MEIITNKTAYYTIFLPIYLGLVLCDCDISTLQSPLLKEICTVLGQYFQIKDDYLDVFADPSVLGKVRVDKFSYKQEGTDIQEGKCSWVILTVLSVCSEEDRTFLQQMYGKKDAQCVASVKQLFNRYNVNEKFCAYEDTTNQRVKELIATNGFPARLIPVFQLLTQKLFRKA